MAWIVENRRVPVADDGGPYLTEALKAHLREVYFPRYPTKRALTLPALHAIQHEHGWVPMKALEELAEFLEISPAEVLDTASFYEEFWLKPKGKYLIGICRSLACELTGSKSLTDALRKKLGIELGETTPDGKFTLIHMECLGACGGAPCGLVNEVLHENLTVENLDRVLDALPDEPSAYRDPTVNWPTGH